MSVEASTSFHELHNSTPANRRNKRVLVGSFWSDRSQEVTFHRASLDLACAIEAVYFHLCTVGITDLEFRIFLLDRVKRWSGIDTQITTVPQGKLVMLATPLASATTPECPPVAAL